MKHINKTNPPNIFLEFLKKRHPKNWNDIYKEPGLYVTCRDQILQKEQNNMGGYTERPLQNSKTLHIDHYRKKGMNWNTDVSFDWDNLIVEERTEEYGACYKDSLTNDINDYDKLLNPVIDYPESLFSYRINGEIIAKEGLADERIIEKVNFTIDRFNLNHHKLIRLRGNLISLILYDYTSLSDQEIREAFKDMGFPTVIEWALAKRMIL